MYNFVQINNQSTIIVNQPPSTCNPLLRNTTIYEGIFHQHVDPKQTNKSQKYLVVAEETVVPSIGHKTILFHHVHYSLFQIWITIFEFTEISNLNQNMNFEQINHKSHEIEYHSTIQISWNKKCSAFFPKSITNLSDWNLMWIWIRIQCRQKEFKYIHNIHT